MQSQVLSVPRSFAVRFTFALTAVTLLTNLSGTASATETQVTVTLVPHTEAVGHLETVSFGLPLPPGLLTDASLVTVRDASGQEIPAYVRSLGPWRSLPPASLQSAEFPLASTPGLRSVLVQFQRTFASTSPVGITVVLNQRRTRNLGTETPVRSTWRLVREGTYVGADKVYEPKVYALLPPEWLVSTNLTTLAGVSGAFPEVAAFDKGQVDFFHTVINDFNPNPDPAQLVPYKTDSEPWLYDRAQTFYNGYLRTGRFELLREAHRAAQHYMSSLYTPADETRYPGRPLRGFFKLKSGPYDFLDSKYSYNECLSTLYWLTGDAEPKKHLPDVTAATQLKVPLADVPTTTAELNCWTERNIANALLALLFDYEVTGSAARVSDIRSGLNALYTMQNTPALGKPKNGAFNHYPEESGTSQLAFSPWMSSLLAHALLRAYHTVGDARIPDMLVDLAQAVLDRALYLTTLGDGKQYWVPRYIASSYGTPTSLAGDRYADSEHAIDVAYVTALGAYFSMDATQRGRLATATRNLLATHGYVLRYWTRTGGWPGNGAAIYRVTPPRKYAWWFKNAGAIGPALNGNPAPVTSEPSDTTAPTVSVTSPVAGATLAGTVAVAASASDNVGVAGVQFLLDGKPLGIEDTAAPYSVPLDSATLTAGTHTLAARARDAAGNQATSAGVSVTVPSLPPPPTDSAGTTVTFRQGVGGYTGAQDYVLSTQGATYNGGNGITTDGTRMLLYRGAYETRVLLRFGKLTLPAGAVVQSATLTLNLENPSLGVAVGGYYLQAPWNGTSTETVSWLRRDLEAEWAVPGAGGSGTDRVLGKSFGLVVESYDKRQTVDLDPGIVQGWVSDPSTNQGVELVPLTEGKALYISASDHDLVSARPTLTVTYIQP